MRHDRKHFITMILLWYMSGKLCNYYNTSAYLSLVPQKRLTLSSSVTKMHELLHLCIMQIMHSTERNLSCTGMS